MLCTAAAPGGRLPGGAPFPAREGTARGGGGCACQEGCPLGRRKGCHAPACVWGGGGVISPLYFLPHLREV